MEVNVAESLKEGGSMSSQEWKKSKMTAYALRISNATGIPDAIKLAAEDMKISQTQYVRRAICEKLISDGYLPGADPHNAEWPEPD